MYTRISTIIDEIYLSCESEMIEPSSPKPEAILHTGLNTAEVKNQKKTFGLNLLLVKKG